MLKYLEMLGNSDHLLNSGFDCTMEEKHKVSVGIINPKVVPTDIS